MERDAQWVIDAQAGDQAAFGRLVASYQKRAVSVAYRLLNRVDDATDVAQDAFLRAYQNLEKLDDPRKFAAWLMRIVTNLALNYRRSRTRRSMASTEGVIEFDEAPRSPTGDRMEVSSAADTLAANDLRRVVRERIDALPEKQRTALTLFALEGLSQKEVAEIMDCSLELVKWNVFQARKQLRTDLADIVESD